MVNINPIVGILATPYIHKDSKKSKEIFLSETIINILKKENIDILIIPYNLTKNKLKLIVQKLDGIIFPGSQVGNYYCRKEFKEHFNSQSYLIKIIKKMNKYRLFPLLSICHGFENLLLIESKKKPTKKTIKNFFMNTKAYFGYKTCPLYCKNQTSKQFKKYYKKSNKMIFNNKLGISPKTIKNLKSIDLVAISKDKKNKSFVNIIKYKNYPFYGFQGHPERRNIELLKPFILDVKKSIIYKNNIYTSNNSNKIKKFKKLIKTKITRKCKKYGLSKDNNKKCYFYKI